MSERPEFVRVGFRRLFADTGGGGGGSVNSVSGTAGQITSSGGTDPVLALASTAVTPGSYTNMSGTVDAKGRFTAAASGPAPVTSVSGTAGQIAFTAGTTPVGSLEDTTVTPGSYTNMSGTVDAKGRFTAAASGPAPATSASSPLSLVAGLMSLLNSGSTGGRLGGYILDVENAGLSAVTVFNRTLNASYKRLLIQIIGTGGLTSGIGNSARLRFNGDTGNNYLWAYNLMQGSGTGGTGGANVGGQKDYVVLGITAAAPAADVSAFVFVESQVVAGVSRRVMSFFTSVGSSDANFIDGYSGGVWKNTTDVITDVNLLFGSAFTGKVEIWGVPA